MLGRVSEWFMRDGVKAGSRKRNMTSGVKVNGQVWRYPAPPDHYPALARDKGSSRYAARHYDYARSVVLAMRRGVLGADGIRLRSLSASPDDRMAVEAAWSAWGRVCDAEGTSHWRRLQHVILNSLVVDGEAFVLLLPDREWGLRIRVLDSMQIDSDLTGLTKDGNEVSLGVERDTTGRVVAYHFRTLQLPRSSDGAYQGGLPFRVPADQVLHAYDMEMPGQSRGVPWLLSAIKRLEDLRDYEESERTAARLGAKKLGFIQTPEGTPGEVDADDEDVEVEAGSLTHLDPGEVFAGWDPAHPNTAFGDFVNSQLRGAASGTGLSYFEVANDLAGVNFSSARVGLLAQREIWRMAQRLLEDRVFTPLFEAWLPGAIAAGKVMGVREGTPPSALMPHEWVGRRHEHVQPREQARADSQRLADGLTSRAEIIRSEGRDPDEVFAEIEKERGMFGEVADGSASESPVDGGQETG